MFILTIEIPSRCIKLPLVDLSEDEGGAGETFSEERGLNRDAINC